MSRLARWWLAALCDVKDGIDRFVARTEAAHAEYEHADPVDNHDWHNPTGYGLRCRRCDLSHKLWSGQPCPEPDA